MTSDTAYDNPDKILKADDASAMVLNRYWYSRDELVSTMRDKFKEWYKSYRAYVEKGEDNIRSKLVLPLIFSHVESYLPRLVVNRPRIEAWGRGEEDKIRARQHRALLFYDWDIMHMPFKVVNFVKSAEIYGTAWLKVWYKKESRIRVVKEQQITPRLDPIFNTFPVGQEISMIDVERPIETYNDPEVDLLEVDEVFPHPDSKDEETAPWIIHRRQGVGLDHLEKAMRASGEPLYKPEVVARLKKVAKDGNQQDINMDETVARSRKETFGPETSSRNDQHMREFTLLEMWTNDKLVVIVEEFPEVPPLRNEINPYGMKPFVRFTPIPDPNNIYGIGVPEILYGLQLEMSTLHQVRMDHALQSAHMMMKIVRSSNINANNIRIRPGGAIYVEDQDDIEFMQPPPLEFALYRESDDLRLHAQQASGATDTFTGVRSAGGNR
jgi:hypothetical protein